MRLRVETPPVRFSAVIPAWQEAKRIASTVEALWRIDVVAEVVVVDDGSTDGTARRAREAGARVVTLPRRQGKGSALLAGVGEAREAGLLLCDADLGDSAARLAPLCDAVRDAGADLAIGIVPGGTGAGFGMVRRLARLGVSRLAGTLLQAPLSGQRALKARVAPLLLAGPPCGFGVEVRMDVRALRLGLRVVEVEVPVAHRPSGWDWYGIRHRGRQLYDVSRALAQLAWEARGRPAVRGGCDGHGG